MFVRELLPAQSSRYGIKVAQEVVHVLTTKRTQALDKINVGLSV